MNNRKLIFNLVVILNANALAMAATGTWHSIATGSNLTYTASSTAVCRMVSSVGRIVPPYDGQIFDAYAQIYREVLH